MSGGNIGELIGVADSLDKPRFVRNGKELERAKPLFAEYKAKYNVNKGYLDILEKLME